MYSTPPTVLSLQTKLLLVALWIGNPPVFVLGQCIAAHGRTLAIYIKLVVGLNHANRSAKVIIVSFYYSRKTYHHPTQLSSVNAKAFIYVACSLQVNKVAWKSSAREMLRECLCRLRYNFIFTHMQDIKSGPQLSSLCLPTPKHCF